MKIQEAYFHFRVEFVEKLVGLAKGAIGGWHVGAALKIQHRARHAVAGAQSDDTPAGGIGIVGGTQQPRLAREIIVDFPLVPYVIAAGEHIQTQAE